MLVLGSVVCPLRRDMMQEALCWNGLAVWKLAKAIDWQAQRPIASRLAGILSNRLSNEVSGGVSTQAHVRVVHRCVVTRGCQNVWSFKGLKMGRFMNVKCLVPVFRRLVPFSSLIHTPEQLRSPALMCKMEGQMKRRCFSLTRRQKSTSGIFADVV